MSFQAWYDVEIGKPIDEDKFYGNQCVDVAMSWVDYLFGAAKWPQVLGLGNAKDLFNASNPDYVRKISYSAGLVPSQGDMPVFGATATNPYGHIAVVISASATEMVVIEQNGFNPSGVAYVAHRPYSSNLIGWLRPKGVNMDTVTKQDVDNLIPVLTGKVPTAASYGFVGQSFHDFIYGIVASGDFKGYVTRPAPTAQPLPPGIYQVK